jgi:hypothetical protein
LFCKYKNYSGNFLLPLLAKKPELNNSDVSVCKILNEVLKQFQYFV